MTVDIIFKIAAIGILVTVITQVLKKSDRDDMATLVSLVGLIIVLTLVINMVSELFDTIKNIFYLY
ncbi:MAG: stage III sporulation protein AC [Christensenellaceae bacterium]